MLEAITLHASFLRERIFKVQYNLLDESLVAMTSYNTVQQFWHMGETPIKAIFK